MKKVLVTGAAGTIGLQVIRYLLIEGKYEITALDLKNAKTYKRLKRYRKRINIIYGDVNDKVVVDALVKDHDVVIHLAGVLPPFADFKEELCHIVDYEGTQNIIDAINNYNPKCYLIYSSTATIYGDKKKVTVKDKPNFESTDYYTKTKFGVEKLIKEKISNYTIYRIPNVMCNPRVECPMYNVPANSKIELISSHDVGYALVMSLEHKKELNKKIFNLSGGEKCRVSFREYLIKILSTYGLNVRYLLTFFLVDKNFYGAYYEDGEDLDKILHFRKDSILSYYNELEENYSGLRRLIPRLLAKPVVAVIKKKDK